MGGEQRPDARAKQSREVRHLLDSAPRRIYRDAMRMMLMGAMLVVAAACGGDGSDEPTDDVACDAEWSTIGPFNPQTCARACVKPTKTDAPTCKLGGLVCSNVVVIDGVPGCCIFDTGTSGEDIVALRDCDP